MAVSETIDFEEEVREIQVMQQKDMRSRTLQTDLTSQWV